ncbi:MAG: hypothetical protein Q7J34_10140 [Bacteroidales bacterium]|nr:hypothetical protein [Bacteroidales bacterium]
MDKLFRFIFVFSWLIFSGSLHAQSPFASSEKAYGLDPLLHNGKIYTYILPPGTEGDPFFNPEGFVKGSVLIRGIQYDNLFLKYDTYNQYLIFQYTTFSQGTSQIIISDAWLESFSLGDKYFEIRSINDTVKRFYQVIGEGSNRILYAWRKKMELDSRHGATNYIFSDRIRTAYLQSGSKLVKYKNNRQFIRFFESERQPLLRKYLRKQNVNVKRASDRDIIELLNFCNTQLFQ